MESANPHRGRFRSYLLGALKHFLSDRQDYDRAAIRGGRAALLPLTFGPGEERYLASPSNLPPEALYERQWALALIDRVLNLLHAEQEAAGRAAVFDRLKGFLTGEEDCRPVAAALGMSEGAVRVVNDGAGCRKPAPYGRGAGSPWKFGDPAFKSSGQFERCEADHGKGNCELDGAVVYPKCKSGFHNVGCCTCSPDCPAGSTDSGVTCTKPSYGRGTGNVSTACPGGKVNDAGLCYENCRTDFSGAGPVCWGSARRTCL